MKGDIDDLRAIGEDMKGLLQRHPDAVRSNPDLAGETVRLRDKWLKRYEQASETAPLPNSDLIP